VLADGLVLTFPATAGWVGVVPVFDTTLFVMIGGGLDLNDFFGAYSCKKYYEVSSFIL
jgi:hypothetical protein